MASLKFKPFCRGMMVLASASLWTTAPGGCSDIALDGVGQIDTSDGGSTGVDLDRILADRVNNPPLQS